MATMKTLGFVSGAGFKCLNRILGIDLIPRTLPAIHSVPVRYARFKSSPLISDDSTQYTGFEISRNPEEWKFVQDLLPQPVIKKPSPKPEYPSGWKPQNPPADSPYFIQRTANHMLPVYLKRDTPRGVRKRTVVRYIQGDVWALEEELRAVVSKTYPKDIFNTMVNEVAGQITFRGDYVSVLKAYLESKGW
ncbi:putative 39S ribosomal protein L49, mitochondrial [Frankliniella fusca]|uniref:Large ribosomal subunit protein mL49 n=1 Tax=Frankliniella fusca TaxID=407009 RepID=A0AAE1LET7_9NEOP|nr:putative 39S ribosomal protein L49, mitochondrial [Frankliniella fusca]